MSCGGVQIKVEDLTEVERSNIVESTTTNVYEIEVEVLPTPEKVNLIVSIIDNDENLPAILVPVDSTSHNLSDDVDKANVTNQSGNVDGPSNKKQKLMTNSSETISCPPRSSVGPCSTFNDDHQYDDVKIVDGKIVFNVKNQEELNKKIEFFAKLPDISSVKIFEIKSNPDDNLFIGYKQIKVLSTISLPQLEKLHFWLNFHENVTAKLFEDLLVKFGENLVHFHVTGGYIGTNKEEIIIRIPALPKLEHFAFQSIYNFDTNVEIIEPAKVVVDDGGFELLVLEDNDNEIPQIKPEIPQSNELFRITVFLPRLKCLKEIILGNYIKVITSDPLKSEGEEFSFEHFKALEVFRVGSPWNKIVHFLPAKFNKVTLKEIQFPDFLNDPSVLGKIAEIFPNLESVRLYLPYPFVLQEFIQIFSKLKLKELYLRTSFLLEHTDVKILCGLYRAKEGEEERKIAWVGVHGNLNGFKESEKELEKNQKGKNKKKTPKKMLGLGSLKRLEKFKYRHIPRKIYFTKFKKTIGFKNYSKGFPGRKFGENFIQELRMMKKLIGFRFPSMHKNLKSYLDTRFGGMIEGPHTKCYPKLLKVNKTDAGKKMKSEVKQENQTS